MAEGHQVDTVLVGLQFTPRAAKDEHYTAIGTLCVRSPPLKMCSWYVGSKLCNSSSARRRSISFQMTTCTLTISAIGAWRSTLHARSS